MQQDQRAAVDTGTFSCSRRCTLLSLQLMEPLIDTSFNFGQLLASTCTVASFILQPSSNTTCTTVTILCS